MEQLKRLRTEKGLSQVRLAARAEVDPSTLNQVERGARDPSPATLRKLARALDVSLFELMEGDPPKLDPAPEPQPLSWALSAPAKEYAAWILDAAPIELHKKWILLSEYAQKLEIGEQHRFVIDRAQQAIDQYFRLNPPSAVRPRKGKREVEAAHQRAANE
jgi:transcriptional regulator with XRE-family HTH domain